MISAASRLQPRRNQRAYLMTANNFKEVVPSDRSPGKFAYPLPGGGICRPQKHASTRSNSGDEEAPRGCTV